MAAAPWDEASDEDQVFVLITGANSGIGLAIGKRLIDEFFIERSLSAHLVVITTTRSQRKSRETTEALRSHLKSAAHSSKALLSKAGVSYNPKDAIRRVHIFSIELDLCKLPGVYEAADQLINGTLDSPSDSPDFASLADVRIPRLDALICNAGMGGWDGIAWPTLFKQFFTHGYIQMCTFPIFKATTPGRLIDGVSGRPAAPQPSDPPGADRLLGEVFCANVFGHYVLAHQLLPLLSRAPASRVPPGRIVWESSIEAYEWTNLSLDDFQAHHSPIAYESTKRLTDVLALTAHLPAVRAASAPFFRPADEDQAAAGAGAGAGRRPPRQYLTHPGVVCSSIFPLSALLLLCYKLAMLAARLLGSPWHPVSPYKGAAAPVWVALRPQGELDALRAESAKWGSATTRWGAGVIKKTEVEGWGWEGKVEDRAALVKDPAARIMRNMVGRYRGAVDLTRESLEDFEVLGLECWREMERLRMLWDGILGGRGASKAKKARA